MSEKQSVRLFFVLLLPVLLGVFALSMAGLEPYPALVFPGFEESGDPDGRILYDKPEFQLWSDGQPLLIDHRDLLSELPESYVSAVLQKRFARDANNPESSETGVKRFSFRAGAYDYAVERVPRALTPAETAEMANFLNSCIDRMIDRGQLPSEQYSSAGFDSLTVDWTKTEVFANAVEKAVQTGNHFHISLQTGIP